MEASFSLNPSSKSSADWDVLVIGAGVAGLTTAYRLLQEKPDCRVLVLEAKDRVGGRTLSTELQGAHGKDVWDLGGQWVGNTQHHLLWLMEELGLEKYPQYTTGKKLMLLGNKGIRSYKSSIPSMSLFGLINLHNFMTLGGAQQISKLLVDKIGQEQVLLGQPVEHIDQQEADKVTVVTASGKTFSCQYVVVAAPLHCSTAINYTPAKPFDRINLAQLSPMGHIIKFIVTYQTAFWREDGFSGEIVSNGGKPTIEGLSSGPLQLTYDCTTSNGNPAIVGFYANSREWSHIEPQTRKQAVLDSLAEFLGPKARDPLDYCEKDWALESYNGGCPVNIMTPGAMTFHSGLRTPFFRVHWAGTETATHHTGFINGAVQSGMRAADEVLRRLEPHRQADRLLICLDNQRKTHWYGEEVGKWKRRLFIGGAIGVAVVTALTVKRWGLRGTATYILSAFQA